MISQSDKRKLRTWVEIDRSALKKNVQTFRNIIPKDCILMGMVKSNAYGHGIIEISSELVKNGVNFLGVDSFEEAITLRKAGIKTRVLVVGYTAPDYYEEAIKLGISITASNFVGLEALKKLKGKKKIKVHIKADTGLGRQGFQMDDMKKVLTSLKKNTQVEVEGLYSHLAVGEDPTQRNYTELQMQNLLAWVKLFNENNIFPIRHLCASASTMLFPECHFDMVRIGIGLYGLWASRELKEAVGNKYTLHPVLSWKAIITEIKHFNKGVRIGYDLTEELSRNSNLGIVPIGYWHGYPRALSGKGTFAFHGKKIKLIGRVSMDMIVVDVTDVKNARVGDEVAIIGGKDGHYAETDMMAQDSDTINYEITTRINPIIKRFYRINPTIKRIHT